MTSEFLGKGDLMTTRTLVLLIGSAAALALATAASARPDPERIGETVQVQQSQDPRQGIRNAREAGIYVDPAVEEMMARAPIGSCANDPSLDSCPMSHAIVRVQRGALSYRAARLSNAAAVPQCAIRVTEQSPYKAAGYAQMDAANQCFSTVTLHELYGSLWKHYDGRWHHMNTRAATGLGGTTIRVHTTYDCTASPLRAWRARGEGYALLGGTWYAETQEKHGNLACG